MIVARTPSQTIGPFFGIGLPWVDGPHCVPPGSPGALWLRGRVLDGAGDPVPDALIETWQADAEGAFADAAADRGGFRGFARCPTDAEGRYAILTIKPAALPAPRGGLEAPHIDVLVFARGLLKHLVTRVYLADEATANNDDPILATIADPGERATLIAERADDGYRFDIRLQGERETVFFEL